MTGATVTPTERGAGAALRASLEETLPRFTGRPVHIATVRRERSSFAASYPVDIVTVELDDGEELKAVLKDFGSQKLVKRNLEERRNRERLVYRELLVRAELGTPAYLGSVWDEATGRYWLLLELVEGMPVRYLDFEHWVAAAGWLGRMEGRFAPQLATLDGCSYLRVLDRAFFEATAEGAARSLRRYPQRYARRMGPIAKEYGTLIDTMTTGPQSLVHGAYRPGQIVIGDGPDPRRICPVDWELASIGSILFDLAHLASGFERARTEILIDAYASEAGAHGVNVPSAGEMAYRLDCFRLHQVMHWLALAHDRDFPEPEIENLTGMAEQISAEILT
jgi:aminoglycoside phosphotransferase (APT) family kinase protein